MTSYQLQLKYFTLRVKPSHFCPILVTLASMSVLIERQTSTESLQMWHRRYAKMIEKTLAKTSYKMNVKFYFYFAEKCNTYRSLWPITGPSEDLKIRGCQYYLVGIICLPLVEIGLTDLPKSGGAIAPPVPPGTTPLKEKKMEARQKCCRIILMKIALLWK